jgi:hypothetical protein
MPEVSGSIKRVVLIHADGMAQILGTGTVGGDLPVTIGSFEALGREIPFASLYRVTSRAAYFKAPTVPKSFNTFHENQK